MRIFFTTINLEPKYVEDVILAALILHNIMIKSPDLVNFYRAQHLLLIVFLKMEKYRKENGVLMF